jgi:hypothetical protein
MFLKNSQILETFISTEHIEAASPLRLSGRPSPGINPLNPDQWIQNNMILDRCSDVKKNFVTKGLGSVMKRPGSEGEDAFVLGEFR